MIAEARVRQVRDGLPRGERTRFRLTHPISSLFRRLSGKDEMAGNPERDATRLLELAWGVPGEPGFVVPVDPVRIAQQLGVAVYTSRLEEDLAGVLAKQPGEDAVIVLNAGDSSNRQRFTCAHELGHLIKRTNSPTDDHAPGDAEDYEYVDRRDTLSSLGNHPEEVYANGFAAALLMPQAEVRKRHRRDVQPFELALAFRVSPEAMKIRFETLGLTVG